MDSLLPDFSDNARGTLKIFLVLHRVVFTVRFGSKFFKTSFKIILLRILKQNVEKRKSIRYLKSNILKFLTFRIVLLWIYRGNLNAIDCKDFKYCLTKYLNNKQKVKNSNQNAEE